MKMVISHCSPADDYKLTITVSYDEQAGHIQAIFNTAPDLRPTSEHEVYVMQNHKRSGNALFTGWH